MTEQEFCKKYSEYFGEQVDDIRQIEFHEFNGSELYEFAQELVNKNALLHDVSGSDFQCLRCPDPNCNGYCKEY